MQHNLTIVDNFYDNIEEVRDFAIKQKYYPCLKEMPDDVREGDKKTDEGKKIWDEQISKIGHFFVGKRSLSVEYLNKKIYDEFIDKMKLFVQLDPNKKYTISTHFHLLIPSDKTINIHQDKDTLIAGLIYLNPVSPNFQGTFFYKHNETGNDGTEKTEEFDAIVAQLDMIKVSSNKDFSATSYIDNKYNRCVFYNPYTLHSAPDGFGENQNCGRLTQPFFIREVNV